ncbi:hypothetical protein ACSSTF_004845 [Escherichia coli]
MLEKGEKYDAKEFLKDQLVYLYDLSREENTTTSEKIFLSLAMVKIYESISQN